MFFITFSHCFLILDRFQAISLVFEEKITEFPNISDILGLSDHGKKDFLLKFFLNSKLELVLRETMRLRVLSRVFHFLSESGHPNAQ